MEDISYVVYFTQLAIWLILKSSMYILVPTLLVGLLVSFFQIATQIQDNTFTFVFKAVTVFLFVILFSHKIFLNIKVFFYEIIQYIKNG